MRMSDLYLALGLLPDRRMAMPRRAFTMLELLVVVVIIGLVSGLVLPPVIYALQDRYCSGGADILRGAVAAAQSDATVANQTRGVRLLPDAHDPQHFTGVVQLRPAADYLDGLARASGTKATPIPFSLPFPCLMAEQCLVNPDGSPANPTYWYWNIRIGETIRFTPSGPRYTVVGPNVQGTPDGFVNLGPPNTVSPLQRPDANGNLAPVEFLFLVNGQDDDKDGFPDNGHDGVTTAYEQEQWIGPVPANPARYVISRRPIQDAEARRANLPSGVYVDYARSSLPPIGPAGNVEIMFHPGGEINLLNGPYSVPSAIGFKTAGIEMRVSQSIAGHDQIVSVLKSGKVSSEAASD